MNTYQVRIEPDCTYTLPLTKRVIREGGTTVVNQQILNDNRDLFEIIKTNPLLRVRVKAGCHHRSGQVLGNQICWVTQAEFEAFGDKFDLLSDDEIKLSRVALPDETGEEVTYDITSKALALAEEHGVDVAQVKGTGVGDRVVVRDIQAVIDSGDAQ